MRNCSSTYSVYSSLSAHLSRMHRGSLNEVKENILTDTVAVPIEHVHQALSDQSECDSNPEASDESCSEDVLQKHIALMLLKLQVQCHVPSRTLQVIVHDVDSLME